MPSRPHAQRAQRLAFTLVEVLLALSLTGLVVAVSGRVALQTSESRRTAQRFAARMERTAMLEAAIAQDLSRILPLSMKSRPPLVVVDGSVLVLELAALAAVPTDDRSLHVPLRPCLVRLWQTLESNETLRLERQLIDLTVPAQVFSRELLASGLDVLRIEARRKGQWSELAPPSLLETQDIDALRIHVSWLADSAQWVRTFRIEHAKQE